ncbi:DUF2742 domain-containing protein [Mycolicibacillus parakoreensis]|uniref:DUF2742 domain-containing protein n=1 Tax=Mycolicibacillus parakoreensis TaxID=1069221 RepID=A0ABY3U1V2_9MYCO|nr:DUF2742 domain-containing protein [Mycolicibacillus parakoreensis]ULN51537.1 DUF2742 domain-containing protein [Mycolicibacillus parakoreensis]
MSFWEVHQWVERWIADREFPMAGTVAWQSLSDADPAKWAAILDAAQHHILRVETAQEAQAAASHAISASTDWSQVASEIRRRTDARKSGARIERQGVAK